MTERQKWARRYLAPFLGTVLAFLIAFGLWPPLSNLAWPASRYYELISITVGNAKVGEPVPLRVVRVIRRPFKGSYNVSIRKAGQSAPLCNGGMPVDYRPGNDPVAERDLAWWTAGAVPDCVGALLPGQYVLSSCIYVHSPAREICRDSNVFTIEPA